MINTGGGQQEVRLTAHRRGDLRWGGRRPSTLSSCLALLVLEFRFTFWSASSLSRHLCSYVLFACRQTTRFCSQKPCRLFVARGNGGRHFCFCCPRCSPALWFPSQAGGWELPLILTLLESSFRALQTGSEGKASGAPHLPPSSSWTARPSVYAACPSYAPSEKATSDAVTRIPPRSRSPFLSHLLPCFLLLGSEFLQFPHLLPHVVRQLQVSQAHLLRLCRGSKHTQPWGRQRATGRRRCGGGERNIWGLT